MSMSVTTTGPPESQQDYLGAILLALIASNNGITVAKADVNLAMDLMNKGEEIDLATTP